MMFPKVLLISNRFDFSTDFIAVELANQGIDFIRINRDELKDYTIDFDPIKPEIKATYNDYSFTISTDHLKSIYYRAPTFLRDIFQEGLSEEEQLIRTQWAAFVRSLCVFENVKWLNNPTDIYKAEIKPYQLFIANKLGIKIPKTTVSNVTLNSDFEFQAIKSIDTAIVSSGENEGFVYTEIYKKNELEEVKYTSPFFIQQGLVPKTDIRVTIVENDVVAIKITSDKEINEDWRRYKDELTYSIFELPKEVHDFCINYTKKLNLNFGAIDLVLHNNDYYFIEINPTGEWSWLQKNTGFAIASLDYQPLVSTVTFAPGQLLANVPVTIINDDLDEPDETVVLTITDATNATFGTTRVHTLTITDDDLPPTIAFLAVITHDLGADLVRRDRPEPRAEAGVSSKLCDGAKGEDEGLMRDLVHEMRHGQLEGDKGVNRIQMPFDQRVEGMHVADLDGSDQLGVFGGVFCDGCQGRHE